MPKEPKIKSHSFVHKFRIKGNTNDEPPFKDKNFLKVKEEQVGHFLQLAMSVIYNNYTYIHIYIYIYSFVNRDSKRARAQFAFKKKKGVYCYVNSREAQEWTFGDQHDTTIKDSEWEIGYLSLGS